MEKETSQAVSFFVLDKEQDLTLPTAKPCPYTYTILSTVRVEAYSLSLPFQRDPPEDFGIAKAIGFAIGTRPALHPFAQGFRLFNLAGVRPNRV